MKKIFLALAAAGIATLLLAETIHPAQKKPRPPEWNELAEQTLARLSKCAGMYAVTSTLYANLKQMEMAKESQDKMNAVVAAISALGRAHPETSRMEMETNRAVNATVHQLISVLAMAPQALPALEQEEDEKCEAAVAFSSSLIN
jgi:hypothetical protein